MIHWRQIEALSHIDDMSKRLEFAALLTSGNIVEIGGGEGINTLHFLRVAKDRDATVIVIDPFEQLPGADESYFKPYSLEAFKKTINEHPDLSKNMLLIDLPSQHKDVAECLKAWRPIGFMFIDGLQDKDSILSDLALATSLDVELICIDDYDRLTPTSQVPVAIQAFLEVTDYNFINIGKREAYFIKT